MATVLCMATVHMDLELRLRIALCNIEVHLFDETENTLRHSLQSRVIMFLFVSQALHLCRSICGCQTATEEHQTNKRAQYNNKLGKRIALIKCDRIRRNAKQQERWPNTLHNWPAQVKLFLVVYIL